MPLEPSFALRAIVTGSHGFVGRALLERLAADAVPLRLSSTDWRDRVAAADFRGATVFHLAARSHDLSGTREQFALDNEEKTRVLAQRAASGGARRFVFLSTIKVLGEETGATPFRASDEPRPQDEYARSKHAAECAVREIAGAIGWTIVRSPLVVGPHVRGNLRSLLRLADSPWPLPLGAIDNRRTLVQVDDLAALLCLCAQSPQAQRRVFLAGDAEAISTTRLVESLRRAFGRPARLVRIAPQWLECLAAMTGSSKRVRRLTRSLEVDASEARELLGWRSAIGVERGLAEMASAYRAERAGTT
ncbi:MAG: NAD-dependent epimerase/dehydratase family protein [Bacillota bacterium]